MVVLWDLNDLMVLVGGLEHLDYFSIYWECHHPNWLSLHHSSEGWRKTTNQSILNIYHVWMVYCNYFRMFCWSMPTMFPIDPLLVNGDPPGKALMAMWCALCCLVISTERWLVTGWLVNVCLPLLNWVITYDTHWLGNNRVTKVITKLVITYWL